MGRKLVVPKTKCCVSSDRCQRCPIQMLKNGTLPDGLAVRKRVLVDASTGKRVKSAKKVKKLTKLKKVGKLTAA